MGIMSRILIIQMPCRHGNLSMTLLPIYSRKPLLLRYAARNLLKTIFLGCTDGADPTAGMNPRQKKLWELRQKLRASRKQNQDAVVAEKRRQARPEGAEAAHEKRRWFEEKKKRREEDLARVGLKDDKVSQGSMASL